MIPSSNVCFFNAEAPPSAAACIPSPLIVSFRCFVYRGFADKNKSISTDSKNRLSPDFTEIVLRYHRKRKWRTKNMNIHHEKLTKCQAFNRTASPSSSKPGLAASQDVRLTSLANNKHSSEKAVINITVSATANRSGQKDCNYAVP
jgi:hypothetical protein